jgi:elongator complex protein 2
MNTLTCVRTAQLNQSSKILSGGDEKVLRLFEAPYNFVKTINTLSAHSQQIRFRADMSNEEVESQIETEAKKQPLGLMNKAPVLLANKGLRVDDEEEGGAGGEFDPVTVLTNVNKQKELIKMTEPPVEDVLMARTLWPE